MMQTLEIPIESQLRCDRSSVRDDRMFSIDMATARESDLPSRPAALTEEAVRGLIMHDYTTSDGCKEGNLGDRVKEILSEARSCFSITVRNSRFLSAQQEESLIRFYGKNCFYCGISLYSRDDANKVLGSTGIGFTVPGGMARLIFDHAIPSSRGGPSSAYNCVPCCNHCNATKRNKTLDEFKLYLFKKNGNAAIIFYGEAIAENGGLK